MAVALMESVFFPPADERRTTLSMLGWWEKRRFSYNVVVGTSGVFALAVMKLISIIPPALPMGSGPPWQGVVLFGLAANVCYSLGFGIEFALARVMGRKAPQLGPSLLRQGIAFSIGLTLLPIGVTAFAWIAHAIALMLGKGL